MSVTDRCRIDIYSVRRALNNVDLQQRVLYRRLHKSYSSVLTRVRGVPRVLCYVVKRFLKKTLAISSIPQ